MRVFKSGIDGANNIINLQSGIYTEAYLQSAVLILFVRSRLESFKVQNCKHLSHGKRLS